MWNNWFYNFTGQLPIIWCGECQPSRPSSSQKNCGRDSLSIVQPLVGSRNRNHDGRSAWIWRVAGKRDYVAISLVNFLWPVIVRIYWRRLWIYKNWLSPLFVLIKKYGLDFFSLSNTFQGRWWRWYWDWVRMCNFNLDWNFVRKTNLLFI